MIKLTHFDTGHPIYIRASAVLSVRLSNLGHCIVHVGHPINVTEPVEDVLRLLGYEAATVRGVEYESAQARG